jgi:hypothetical protein
MKVNLKARIERLERLAPIRRRWAAARKEIARREQQSARRLADWRHQQEKLATDVD